ncbi:interleukin-6 receptor subunit beta [Sphaeramia orbicularis]|uniref:Interleukin-6 receptor subunit beta-like n=1 Tax=Sphaeramia orbicularis TaxID=375764 RepID=A0A672Z0D5_9TELE|nr:interleukin-6 receptor subunit beta-like [Sphaeramia orbicularis]
MWCEVHLLTWTVVGLSAVVCVKVTVKQSDLRMCEDDKRLCVTDDKDCHRSSTQKNFNMSCFYLECVRSVTCEWSEVSHDSTGAGTSLIFSQPRGDKFSSCQNIFIPAAVLNISARFWSMVSRPQTVPLYAAVKPPRPVLSVDGTTSNSITVTWRRSYEDGGGAGGCRLRYRAEDDPTWSEFPVSVSVRPHQTSVHVIRRLRPFTAYSAAVACRAESGIWSDWSLDVTVTTKETEPSKPPDVCYRVLRNRTDGCVLLHLMWEGLDVHDVGGRLLGYEVTLQTRVRRVHNATELTLPLVAADGNCSVTVRAFNGAGPGPAASISVDANAHDVCPSVRHLWASVPPSGKGLQVQWDAPKAPPSDPPPVSHFIVQWRSETRPSIVHQTRVGGATTETLIPDIERDDSYLISVFPVYDHQCGDPRSLPASLQHGVLMEVVGLKLVGVTKTTVTVMWAWQRKTLPIRVKTYRLMLRRDSDEQMVSVHLDQWQNTFLDLKPSTEYSLILLADNISRNIITVRTDFDKVPMVATVTLLLIFALCVFIVSISRTVYKWYFFPPISSPRGSTTGQWLMDPKQQDQQKPPQKNILDMDDFKVMDVVGDKSLIVVGPVLKCPSEEESLPSFSRLIVKLGPESDAPPPVSTQQRPGPGWSFHLDHQTVFDEVEGQETRCLTSHHHQTQMCRLFELLNPDQRHDVLYATQQTHRLMDGDVDPSYLTCEKDYISNSCFYAQEV